MALLCWLNVDGPTGHRRKYAVLAHPIPSSFRYRPEKTRHWPSLPSFLAYLKPVHVKAHCSGLMKPDTHLGENARQIEVSDDQTTPYLFR